MFCSTASFLSSGSSSAGKIAFDSQVEMQAPQSMHSSWLMYSCETVSYFASSFVGWMQPVGHASRQRPSLMQASVITCAIGLYSPQDQISYAPGNAGAKTSQRASLD